MEKHCILKSVRTLTEYFKLRYQIRHQVFEGFLVGIPSEDKGLGKEVIPFMLKGDGVEVYWIPCVGIKILKQLIDIIDQRIIIIYKNRSPESEKHTNLFNYTNPRNCCIELFSIQELQYNVFKNFLSPGVSLLTDFEKNEMVNFYGETTHYPKISKLDNICRYLGVVEGDVLAFKRKEGEKSYTTLRTVV